MVLEFGCPRLTVVPLRLVREVIHMFAKIVSAFLLASSAVCAMAQTEQPASSAPAAVMGASSTSMIDAKRAAAQTLLGQEKISITLTNANAPGGFNPYTARPTAGKFEFSSSTQYCNSNGPFGAVYTVKDDGDLLIAITRTRRGCGLVEMVFDPVTRIGRLETVIDGNRNLHPELTLKLN